MRVYVYFAFSFLISLFSTHYFAQTKTISYSILNGLPSNHVYECIESNTGKLWIATERGLVTYDGYIFKQIDLSSGLSTLISWGFFKDRKGRVWLRNRQSPLTYIYNDSIHQIGTSAIRGISFDFINEDQQGNVYIGNLRSNTTIKITPTNQCTQIDKLLLHINSKNEFLWGKDYYKRELAPYGRVVISGDFLTAVSYENPDRSNSLQVYDAKLKTRYDIDLTANKLIILHLSKIDKDNVLVRATNGIYQLHLPTKKLTPYNSKYNTQYKAVNTIYTDRFNNIWYGDVSNGLWLHKKIKNNIKLLIHLPNENISTYFVKNQTLDLITQFGNTYSISTQQPVNVPLLSKENADKLFPENRLKYDLKGVKIDLKGFYISVSNSLKKQWKVNVNATEITNNGIVLKEFVIGSYKTHHLTDSSLIVGTSNGVFRVLVTKNEVHINRYPLDYVFGLSIDSEFIYTVGLGGFQRTNIQTGTTSTILKQMNLINLLRIGDEFILKAENGERLIVDAKTLKLKSRSTHFNEYYKIFNVQGEIWAVGLTKIAHIDLKSEAIIDEINFSDGIDDPLIIGIEKVNSQYLIIGANNVYLLDLTQKQTSINPNQLNFTIASVLLNEKLSSRKKITIHGEQSFIQVNLQCVYFPSSSEVITYYYRLNTGNWVKIKDPSITLFNLPYGHYLLEIRIKNNETSAFLPNKVFFRIDNPLPYYRTSLFYFIIALFISGGIVFVSFRIRKQKIAQINHKFDMANNRIKMLTMQMQPHFLTNILNSLQITLLEGDFIKSNKTIKKLDNYLRLLLSVSQKDFISLAEEINLIERYIDLEQTRITKKLNLLVSDTIKDNYLSISIPVFILQPLVENAIWHGILKHCDSKGLIIIDIQEEHDYYLLSISDDGKGFGKSEYKGNSIALKNIEERLALIDAKRKEKYIFIEDLNPGTKFTLYAAK